MKIIVKITILMLFLVTSSFSQDDELDNDLFLEESFEEDVFVEDKFIEDKFIEDKFTEDKFTEDKFVEEKFVEDKFIEELESSSGLKYLKKPSVDTLNVEELKNKYDIDWSHVISRFGIGTTVIVVSGIVALATTGTPIQVIAIASFKGAAIGAITGIPIGAAFGFVAGEMEEGNLSAARKYAIEGAADEFMWGAIIGATTVAALKFIKYIPYEKFLNEFPKAKKIFGKLEKMKNIKPLSLSDDLPPNLSYISNGYFYHTDQLGRIKYAGGKLRLDKGGKNFTDFGKKIVCPNGKHGDGGHIIANIFGGSGGPENVVSMGQNTNRSAYKKWENTHRKALLNKRNVYAFIEIIYEGISKIPTEFILKSSIDGKIFRKVIKNTPCL